MATIPLKNRIFYSIVGVIFLVGTIVSGFVFFYTKSQFSNFSEEGCEFLGSSSGNEFIDAVSRIMAATTASFVFFAALVSALIVSLLLSRLFSTFEKTKEIMDEVDAQKTKTGTYRISAKTIKKFRDLLDEDEG